MKTKGASLALKPFMKGIVNLPDRQTTLIPPARRKSVSEQNTPTERRTLNATAREVRPAARGEGDAPFKAPQGFVAACYTRAAHASRSGEARAKFDMVA